MEKLEYSFIRSEADNKITLFIGANSSWLEQDLEIGLTDNKELIVKFPDGKEVKSEPISSILLQQLSLSHTNTVFCDENTNFIAELVLEPMNPNYINEITRKMKP